MKTKFRELYCTDKNFKFSSSNPPKKTPRDVYLPSTPHMICSPGTLHAWYRYVPTRHIPHDMHQLGTRTHTHGSRNTVEIEPKIHLTCEVCLEGASHVGCAWWVHIMWGVPGGCIMCEVFLVRLLYRGKISGKCRNKSRGEIQGPILG